MRAAPQPAPLPAFRPGHKFCPTGIGFHVTTQRQEMLVARDRKTFLAPLVKVTGAAAMVVFVMTAHMRHANPTQPLSQGVVGLRADHQVPVVGHDAVGQEVDRITGQALGQYLLEGLKVFGLME